MTDWPFGSLRMFGYDVIVIDPPWRFDLRSEAGAAKSAAAHYDTMSLSDIRALPVGRLARADCLLLLWCCEWMAPGDRQSVLDSWGFTYKSTLVWRKVTANGKPRLGTGYRVRTMHEPVVVATTGAPVHKPLHSVIDGIARQHSRKPEEFYAAVEQAAPAAYRADLFARQSRPGWDTWGREATKFDLPALPADDPRQTSLVGG